MRAAAGVLVVVCVVVATGFWMKNRPEPTPTPEPAEGEPNEPKVGGVGLFASWPKDAPELAIVLTGQTYGYLSPCGCSRPQKGGLERRANFIDTLKAKGWPVIGLDLGDAAPPKGVHKQNLLKYKYTMLSLAEMGYKAIGLGEYDFAAGLYDLLAEYTLNNPGNPPTIVASNLMGVQRGPGGKPLKFFSRAEKFPGGPNGRPMIPGYEVFAEQGKPTIGIVSVAGPTVSEKVEKIDPEFTFENNGNAIKGALGAINKAVATLPNPPAKPTIQVLMYVGKMEHAREAAKAFPQFQLILCQSDDSEPPQFPTPANNGKTLIVQVGHKGQSVGVIGVYPKGAGYELKYQLVPLGEEYLTPPGPAAAKNNKGLQFLEEYSLEVKKQDLLKLYVAKQTPHTIQIQNPAANVAFVGAQVCAGCHAAEFKVWSATKHAQATTALVQATRPSNRQFDGECLECHTTGMRYQTGFKDAVTTPNLLGNQCENCHGPGSAHAAQPNNKVFLAALMAPWKTKPGDKLPDLATLNKLAKLKPVEREAVKLKEKAVVNAVSGMCMNCHDTENDPKFDFYEYFPKIYHSGLKAAGLPPGVGEK
ncbi:Cytochrome c family protein [Fimbriiglobus ruber]|uniref:Cytochrome c family protein n=1 Tax=Fimbriiglobus ruber TaxID=1908690 RepID=A0A225DFY1_9BACT|nr:Cytochrome c family protein [Fimbriiglobus ruber]